MRIENSLEIRFVDRFEHPSGDVGELEAALRKHGISVEAESEIDFRDLRVVEQLKNSCE